MLSLSKISKLSPYSDGWFKARLGMLTSSKISCICAPEGIGRGGMTYIRNKVSEVITGKSTEKNISTEATQWGIDNEPFAIKYFQQVNNIPAIITDKHIVYDERYSSTPDGLLITNEKFSMTDNQEFLNCETLESKSYMTPSIHMMHVECQTPLEIKKINADLYWQVISQMYWADVLCGNAIFFHPDFPESSNYRLGHVVFKKIDLMADFKLFAARTAEAKQIFNDKLNFSNKKQ